MKQEFFFATLANRRADAIAALDAATFAPAIRNHLVQLFRAAHNVEPRLTGVLVGMGCAIPTGQYIASEEDESVQDEASHWGPHGNRQSKYPEVLAFFQAVFDYDILLCHGGIKDLPYINNITPNDLTTSRVKKGAIHGPHGLRARLGR